MVKQMKNFIKKWYPEIIWGIFLITMIISFTIIRNSKSKIHLIKHKNHTVWTKTGVKTCISCNYKGFKKYIR